MSRTKALWISAIFTIAVVLIIGAAVMRPTLSQPEANAAPAATLVTDGNIQATGPLVPAVQAPSGNHDSGHSDHHDSDHKEHHDDD